MCCRDILSTTPTVDFDVGFSMVSTLFHVHSIQPFETDSTCGYYKRYRIDIINVNAVVKAVYILKAK